MEVEGIDARGPVEISRRTEDAERLREGVVDVEVERTRALYGFNLKSVVVGVGVVARHQDLVVAVVRAGILNGLAAGVVVDCVEAARLPRCATLGIAGAGRLGIDGRGGFMIVVVAGFAVWRQKRTSGFAEFWDPILRTSDPVLFCVADQTQYTAISLRDASDPSRQVTLKDNLTAVVIDDLSAITKIAGVLQSAGKHYSLRGDGATNLTDLRDGPSVIIGAYDNAWTLRMLRPLRFHFANNPEMTMFSIVDSQQHDLTRWSVDRRQQVATNYYRDYAIVARFTDDVTGKPTLIAAGIARGGTMAAGEFVTSPALLDEVRSRRPSAKTKNVEVVLSTEIINGEPGTARIEAIHFW